MNFNVTTMWQRVYLQATMDMIANKCASKVGLLFNMEGLESLVKIFDKWTVAS